MRPEELDRIARELRAGKELPGVDVLKRSRVRIAARVGDLFLKVFLDPRGRPEGEARVLASDGRIELRLRRDFSGLSRSKLQAGIEALLNTLDEDD